MSRTTPTGCARSRDERRGTVNVTDRLLELSGGTDIRIAGEGELPRLYPDGDLGAMPPFGASIASPCSSRRPWRPSRRLRSTRARTRKRSRWADFSRSVVRLDGESAGQAGDRPCAHASRVTKEKKMADNTSWESFKAETENVAARIKALVREGNVRCVVIQHE